MKTRFLPFCEYEDVIDEEINCFTIENVTFTKQFGPYTIGTKIDSLSFDFINGTVIEYNLSDQEKYGQEVRRMSIYCESGTHGIRSRQKD